mmetsp:Transcript_32962/g.60335  ORF Transcript_32962/g.60335 Transcript_32962/m.60335 type:complete len:87 (+) Transcript_32962:1362-1622(+)
MGTPTQPAWATPGANASNPAPTWVHTYARAALFVKVGRGSSRDRNAAHGETAVAHSAGPTKGADMSASVVAGKLPEALYRSCEQEV